MTQKEIDGLCEHFVRGGIHPTVRGIVAEIGGSHTTILPLLNDWLERRREKAEKKVSRVVDLFHGLDLIEREVLLEKLNLRSRYVPPPRRRQR